MEQLKHECGVAMIRLLKPLSYYEQKYGTWRYGLNKLYLMMEKQHNRGQEGAGVACVNLDAPAGEEYMFREKAEGKDAITEVFKAIDHSPLTIDHSPLTIDHSPLTIDHSAAQKEADANNGQCSMVNVQSYNEVVKRAAYEAGKRRMVPIFLTTATTAVGVVPMIIAQSSFWMPVGVTIFAGGIGSLIMVVTMLPVVYWKVSTK